MTVLIVCSGPPYEHERKIIRDLFPDDTFVATPGQAVTGRRFDTIVHTTNAREFLTGDSRGREWYDHLVTCLNPDGFIQPLPGVGG